MMLKCGEKNNITYTFGKAEKPIKQAKSLKNTSGRFCTACGKKLSERASFCSRCGSPV